MKHDDDDAEMHYHNERSIKFDVIYCVDTGCAQQLLIEGHNCVVGYDRDGFPLAVILEMAASGLLRIDYTGWVTVTPAGWDFWNLRDANAELPP